ncbi:ATP-grasp domain-containing protein [Lignipirellula cremea]|uniref:ATP-grasp domain-containing protein n=1 Tax=Lignipirellula cremea TaxID=2528010 RepID=A0A518DP75_9BACT|nr:ATP-grasp domain-containing protein [Lignipirellula cremea]QDU93647.1 hypothetical protein Pla8534_14270 [Lignipirellula cremea]
MYDLPDGYDLMLLEEAVWLVTRKINNPAYDFAFESALACRRPWRRPEAITAVARVGAPADYDQLFQQLVDCGITLVNSPGQHRNGSELPQWYPCIEKLTPASVWYDSPPESSTVAESIGWPVFIKGARQTSRHDPRKCIARNPAEYERVIEAYRRDAILGWQQCVIRELVELRPVKCDATTKIQPSFEFRTFWWYNQLVGAGPYWSHFATYTWTGAEREACIAVAGDAAARVDCPFLVVDMAQTVEGQWIVIECNDAQESGYAGVSPFALWNEIFRQARLANG